MPKYFTKQRKILQTYLEGQVDQELSAKKVAEDLKDAGVSLSAIYRNLADMEREQRVVQCHKEGSREFYFRYIGTSECHQQFHLSCRLCAKIEHVSLEESLFLQERIAQQCSFQVDLPNTVFYGICKQCQISPPQPQHFN